MIEVELKYRLPPGIDLVALLAPLAGRVVGSQVQRDIYFQHPARDFRQTDEAFRIRSFGDENILTYKGPLLDRVSKTRVEMEVSFEPGDAGRERMRQILDSLGFVPRPPVVKERLEREAAWEGYVVHLCHDRVEGLGEFFELETLAPHDRWEGARDALLRLAAELGLKEPERRSYLQLLADTGIGE